MKALFTYFKTFEPNTTTQRAIHSICQASDKVKTERYNHIMDKIMKKMSLKNAKIPIRNLNTATSGNRGILKENFIRKPHYISQDKTKVNAYLKSSINLLNQCAVPEPMMSSYQKTFQGLGNKGQVGNLKDYFSISCMTGGMIPDPNTINIQTVRSKKLQND